MPTVTTSFELADGRVLECEYGLKITPGYTSGPPEYCYPEECDVGEPTYTLDGNEVDVNKLPKGLDVIAEKLYNASSGECNYKEHDDDSGYDDYEPYYDDY